MKSKANIGHAAGMELLLEFETAFPGEQQLVPEQYLQGGDKNIILNAAAFFLGFKVNGSKFNDNSTLLQAIFGPENNVFANQVYTRIKAEEKKGVVRIINPYTSLKLFEYFFSKPDAPITQTPAEFERNLFKAYLVLNSEFTRNQNLAFESTDGIEEDLKIAMMMFCMHYPVADKTNYDLSVVWSTQVIKAIYLFQYLEAKERTQPLLTAFLAHFTEPSWQEYLKSLLPLTMSTLKHQKEAHTDIIVEKGEKFEKGCAFVEKLIVQENDEMDQDDFLTTRSKPFYKVGDGVYRIIFDLFLVEKIFKGVYFLLRDVNNTLPQGKKVPGLKGIYCHEFSEQILFYRMAEIIYKGKFI